MGNTKSSGGLTVAAGLRRLQEDQDAATFYKLVDLHGGGELLPWVKFAKKSGDSSILEGLFEAKVKKYMYSEGKGKLCTVAELVKKRNEERNAMLSALKRKKGKGKAGPNVLDDLDQGAMQGDMMKALKFLDGGGKGGKGGAKYREVCWDTNQRGAMGENLMHTCLLQGTDLHNQLVKHLVNTFPKLVNDIFVSEDYYGYSPLHQAIVNEDPEMVRFLVNNGADLHQRCYGAFYCPDDQRESRNDSMEHEWVDVNPKTYYTGRTYWGEYPLSFAACSQQEECFRLLRARKADINMKDTNGNTVLHLMVIHELPEMFDLAYRLGAKLHITNNQNFTPLTLAAFLAKKTMFDHVLTMEREMQWTYGGVVCAAYPLAYIDTIDQNTGELNANSALALIVYGETNAHLDLIDGMMEDLLSEKYNAFGKARLMRKMIGFLLYFVTFFFAFMLRTYAPDISASTVTQMFTMSTTTPNTNVTESLGDLILEMDNATDWMDGNSTSTQIPPIDPESLWFFEPSCMEMNLDFCIRSCHLLDTLGRTNKMRLFLETMTLLAVIMQITTASIDIKRIGWNSYYKTLLAFPSTFIFKSSFFTIIFMIPLRFTCLAYLENILGILAALATGLHFLYFCRGIKFVGPFVLMVYKIIVGDMMRFFIIYLIFVVGFSQSFFLIFADCYRDNPNFDFVAQTNGTYPVNILASGFEAVLRMFIMSIGEFAVFYKDLHECNMAYLGKILFVVFELMVSVMLINLLIAMMARTYQEIAETQKEWKRQWAKVILMLEQSLQPKDRLIALLKYSRPIGTNKARRAFVVKWHLDKEQVTREKEERLERLKVFREEQRAAIKRRQQEGEEGRLSQLSRRTSKVSTMMHTLEAFGNSGNSQ